MRSVFVLSRLVVLCKRGGEGERVREGLTSDTRAIVVGVRVRVQFILMIWYGVRVSMVIDRLERKLKISR